MPPGARRLVGLVTFLAPWWRPRPAGADVRIDPVDAAASTGILWILLGAGFLALWAAVALAWRLLRGTRAPLLKPSVVRPIAVVVVLGWLASFAALLLLQGRPSRGFASALGDVRTVISAQAAYQSANQGLFDGDLRCLSAPSRCIPGYDPSAPTFLDASLASPTVDRLGYRRVFHRGSPAGPEVLRGARVSPSSVGSWAYTAVPLVPGESGLDSYCGDSSGIVCRTTGGEMPTVKDGACVVAPSTSPSGASPPEGCQVLR